MYKITKEQIDSIIKAFFDLNAPVQLYSGVQKLFKELPEIKEEKNEEL